ncbi:ABC transporter substrate-binding protein [Desulfolucanica intricata]|uniref:ABC transporter substrate-binding protein n=1 Tax=Desulfolucanica intricata TaxID=1285191 RepID=UPI00082BBAD6|nr:ABC transporter substrate-binding protein [Desulfolucanica intricata]
MKKKKLLLWLFCATLVLMPVLAGCSSNAPENKAGTENPGNYEKLTFDNYGRKVVIEAMPQKVLTLGPNCSELFVALGLVDKVIGNSLDNHSRGPLPEYADDYAKIPELNYSSATREAVISSGADFIYGIDWQFGSEGLDIAELEEYGMKVYMNSATTFEEAYQEIADIGKIFHIEDKAAAFIADQKERIAAVEKKVSNQEPVKVLVYDSGGEGVYTCGGTNFETLLIEKAGGKNIFDDITDKQWAMVSYEEVLKRDPDIIVVHDYDVPSLKEKIKSIKNDPGLSRLDCVKNEMFIPITLESVLPGVRMAYSVELLAKGFYPDLFK